MQQPNHDLSRCDWCGSDPLYQRYHDEEWGVPTVDDQQLFEFLVLESAQAGLNWLTILRKRENYRIAFDHFDPERVARYDGDKLNALLTNSGIVRHRGKIESAINNAHCFLSIARQFGSFAEYLWGFVEHQPIINHWTDLSKVPTQTELSVTISRDLKQRGIRFFGPTICYAYLQAVGVVNDHLLSCPCHPSNQPAATSSASTIFFANHFRD